MTTPWKMARRGWVCTVVVDGTNGPRDCCMPAVLERDDEDNDGLCAEHAHLAVDPRDAEIAALRAELAAARVGVVTAEVHARAVREAWQEARGINPRDLRMTISWTTAGARTTLLSTLRASGIDDARAVALADEVSDG